MKTATERCERALVGGLPVDVPEIIPPRSVVILRAADEKTPAWRDEIGRRFRIGYYSKTDGFGCIWLVNEKGEYEQTVDRNSLLRYFQIEKLSSESDLYGHSKPRLGPLRKNSSQRIPDVV